MALVSPNSRQPSDGKHLHPLGPCLVHLGHWDCIPMQCHRDHPLLPISICLHGVTFQPGVSSDLDFVPQFRTPLLPSCVPSHEKLKEGARESVVKVGKQFMWRHHGKINLHLRLTSCLGLGNSHWDVGLKWLGHTRRPPESFEVPCYVALKLAKLPHSGQVLDGSWHPIICVAQCCQQPAHV